MIIINNNFVILSQHFYDMTSWRKRVTSIKRKDLTLALFSFNSGCFVLHTYSGTVCYGRKGFLVDTATRSYFASFPPRHNTQYPLRGAAHVERKYAGTHIIIYEGISFQSLQALFNRAKSFIVFLVTQKL